MQPTVAFLDASTHAPIPTRLRSDSANYLILSLLQRNYPSGQIKVMEACHRYCWPYAIVESSTVVVK